MMFRLVVLCACALLLASCLPADPTGKPDFGPETPASEISAVLSEADQGTDPVTDVKLGQFVHYAETQVLNEQFGMVLSDTGLTIIKRDETPEQVTFTAIQNKITY